MAGKAYHAVIALSALLLSGLVIAQGFHPGNAVIINDVAVSNQRFNALYSEYRRGKGVAVGARGDQLELMKQLRREAMDEVIKQQLLIQAAGENGVEVTEAEVDEELAAIREPFNNDDEFRRRLQSESYTEDSFREHLRGMIAAKRYLDGIRMQTAVVSDEEVEQFYNDNPQRLTLPEQVRVRHILRSWRPTGKPDDRKALYDEAQKLLERARGGEDFAELATANSNDSTRVDGGDVGFFRRGKMVPAFERAAFALKPGEISDIVETPYGLHIIKLEERQESRLLTLDEVREDLRRHLQEERMEKAVEQENQRLREKAEIKILIPLGDKKKN